MLDLNAFTEEEVSELERLIDRQLRIAYKGMSDGHRFMKDTYQKDIEVFVIIKAKLVNKKGS